MYPKDFFYKNQLELIKIADVIKNLDHVLWCSEITSYKDNNTFFDVRIFMKSDTFSQKIDRDSVENIFRKYESEKEVFKRLKFDNLLVEYRKYENNILFLFAGSSYNYIYSSIELQKEEHTPNDHSSYVCINKNWYAIRRPKIPF